MARKRKRTESSSCARKARKLLNETAGSHSSLLLSCYQTVFTLRDYLLSRLPARSRVRRSELQAWGLGNESNLLDACLVGVLDDIGPELSKTRREEYQAFTQSPPYSTCHGTNKNQVCSVNEVVDFAVWYLFKSCPSASIRPRHLLCYGLQRLSGPSDKNSAYHVKNLLPGIVQVHGNDTTARFRQAPWTELFTMLGGDAESIFLSLLLDCGLFQQLPSGQNNHLQLSGVPICDLSAERCERPQPNQISSKKPSLRCPSEIKFVRNRMLYGKPSLNKSGEVRFGLRHVHVFERYRNHDSRDETVLVMKYIFPRQFKLHNVFTSVVDSKNTSHQFQDYSYREQELLQSTKRSLPRRLRGQPEEVVRKMRIRHNRCSYTQLLRYYCPLQQHQDCRGANCFRYEDEDDASLPAPSSDSLTVEKTPDFLTHATSASNVSAFCQAVLKRLLPRDILGTCQEGEHNRRVLCKSVDRFIKMRRFETLSLHEVVRGLKVKAIEWLLPPSMPSKQNMCTPELKKRLELTHELLYYIFDSLLIPLVRSNFYVTESGPYRNRLFYFRHDVWRRLAEPSLALMRLTMYEQLPRSQVSRVMESRTLGYSHVRLLPKVNGTRPITNLRRRMMKVIGNRRIPGPSINTQLGPVASALNFERTQLSEYLKGAIFSIGGLHPLLRSYKSINSHQKLYFVKVDVQSCFDSIPQDNLLNAMKQILSHPSYRVVKYAQMKDTEYSRVTFTSLASPITADQFGVESSVASIVQRKNETITQDTGVQKIWQHPHLLKLLKEHVQSNIVKIGKKHFRQKSGIPQGSVLSSMLCSLFYSAFQSECLGFLDKRSLLVRLIDDFLLITADKAVARRFLQVMMSGSQKYGISVNPEKSLANFDLTINGYRIPRHAGRGSFPYCGMAIDTQTLGVMKDRQRKDPFVRNSLTISTAQKSGSVFRRKVLQSFNLQLHPMLLDTDLNSQEQLIATFLETFIESAIKMHQYLRSMSTAERPSQEYVIMVIEDLVEAGIKCARKQLPESGASQEVTVLKWRQMCWIASASLASALRTKQSQYNRVLVWLRALRVSSESSMRTSGSKLQKLLGEAWKRFEGIVY